MSVLIVDDQPPFRTVARTVVGVAPGFEVIAEADSGEAAVDAAAASHPAMVLMDINLPGINGIEATRQILAADPATVVDGRDVREVRGEEILDAVERMAGRRELDVLDGSPPCQSWSMAGKRELMSDPNGELFSEYVGLVEELQPQRPLPGHNRGRVKCRDDNAAFARRDRLCLGPRLLERVPVEHDARPVAFARRDLGKRGSRRHDDRHRCSRRGPGDCDTLGVIPCAGRDEPVRQRLRRQAPDEVGRPPHLE